MSDDNNNYSPQAQNSIWVHEPLPYTVRVRSILDADAPPVIREFKITAYSAFEAWVQAVVEAGGSGLEDMRHKVEHITPDVTTFKALVSATMLNQILKDKK